MAALANTLFRDLHIPVAQDGLIVVGVPVGSHDYEEAEVHKRVDALKEFLEEIASQAKKSSNLLY